MRIYRAFSLLILLLLVLALPAQAFTDSKLVRVDKLLNLLSSKTDMIFIRNGSEYDVNDAVAHLRRKLDYAADKVNSAEEFIDNVASFSSLSGKPYQVKELGGQPSDFGLYLHELLKEADTPATNHN